jgi:hypothetical protein
MWLSLQSTSALSSFPLSTLSKSFLLIRPLVATLKSLFPDLSQVATTATFSSLIPALLAFSPRFLGFLSK